MSNWIEQREKEFCGLKGAVVTKWECIEMALSEDPILWDSPEINYLQCARIDIQFENRTPLSLITCQNDDEFGLYLNGNLSPVKIPDDPHRIFKYRILHELPLGTISEVLPWKNLSNNIATVYITIDENTISFIAAEVYQHQDGSFFIREMDESILVQINGQKPIAGMQHIT